MEIHIARNGEQFGPFSVEEVRRQLTVGTLLPTDLVWAAGAVDWVPLGSLSMLAPAETSAPPSPAETPPVPVVPTEAAETIVDRPPRTSAAAVTSLICGVLSLTILPVLAGVVAVVCGHVALRGIRKSSGRVIGEGMALAGLTTGYLDLGLILLLGIALFFMMVFGGMALPVVGDVQLKGKETDSLATAKILVTACQAYAVDHHDVFPKSLEDLVPMYLPDRARLACPLSPSLPVGYDYFGGLNTDPPDKVLLMSKFHDPDGKRIIGHVDGSCLIESAPTDLLEPGQR